MREVKILIVYGILIGESMMLTLDGIGHSKLKIIFGFLLGVFSIINVCSAYHTLSTHFNNEHRGERED